MKPSVKSSLPIAAILFAALLIPVALVQRWLDNSHPWVPIYDQRPILDRSVFTSDGSLVHLAHSRSPSLDTARFWVYDESLSARREISRDEVGQFWNSSKSLRFTPVHPEVADWWARNVRQCPATLLWWNGPEGQFDLYDRETRLRSKSLGPDGDVTRAPARPQGRLRLMLAEWPLEYSMHGVTSYLLITEDGVLRLNPELQALGFERLFQGKVDGLMWGRGEGGQVRRLNLISGGALWELDFQGPPSRSGSLPDPLVQAILGSGNQVLPLENGNYSVETHVPYHGSKQTMFLLSSDGRVLRRVELDEEELRLRISGRADKPWKNPSPAIRPLLLPSLKLPFYPDPLLVPLLPLLQGEMTTVAMVESVILCMVLAGLVAWHQVRAGRRGWRAFAWLAFTLAAGLAGATAYLIAHWDERVEACPGCGKRRPIAQERCPHCAMPWPKPQKSGFEVLEIQ